MTASESSRGELAIIDFKRRRKSKPSWLENYFVQETAYACMYYEMTGIPVTKLITLMVTPSGEVKVFDKRNKDDYIKLPVRFIKEICHQQFILHMPNELDEAFQEEVGPAKFAQGDRKTCAGEP